MQAKRIQIRKAITLYEQNKLNNPVIKQWVYDTYEVYFNDCEYVIRSQREDIKRGFKSIHAAMKAVQRVGFKFAEINMISRYT